MCHFNIVHAIKPPNLIDLLNWQFAVMGVENRGNGHTWRMLAGFNRRYPTSQISAILYADRGDRQNCNRCTALHHGDRRVKSPGMSPALRRTLFCLIVRIFQR